MELTATQKDSILSWNAAHQWSYSQDEINEGITTYEKSLANKDELMKAKIIYSFTDANYHELARLLEAGSLEKAKKLRF